MSTPRNPSQNHPVQTKGIRQIRLAALFLGVMLGIFAACATPGNLHRKVHQDFEAEVALVQVNLNPRMPFPEIIAHFQAQLDRHLDHPAHLLLDPTEFLEKPRHHIPTIGGYIQHVSLRDALLLITELNAAEIEYNGIDRTILLRKNAPWGTHAPSSLPDQDPFAPFMQEPALNP